MLSIIFSVFEPKAIRDQMVFESFIMLKMFLSATASGKNNFECSELWFSRHNQIDKIAGPSRIKNEK